MEKLLTLEEAHAWSGTVSEVAAVLMVTPQKVRQLLAAGVIDRREADGRIEIARAARCYCDHLLRHGGE